MPVPFHGVHVIHDVCSILEAHCLFHVMQDGPAVAVVENLWQCIKSLLSNRDDCHFPVNIEARKKMVTETVHTSFQPPEGIGPCWCSKHHMIRGSLSLGHTTNTLTSRSPPAHWEFSCQGPFGCTSTSDHESKGKKTREHMLISSTYPSADNCLAILGQCDHLNGLHNLVAMGFFLETTTDQCQLKEAPDDTSCSPLISPSKIWSFPLLALFSAEKKTNQKQI